MVEPPAPGAGAGPTVPRRRVSSPNLKILVGAVVIAIAVGVLLWVAVGRGSVYYYTVSELVAGGTQHDIRVSGRLVPGSLQGLGTTDLTFSLHDRDKTGEVIPVTYSGQLPDGFKTNPDIDVIAEGTYEDGSFHASVITTQCPTKYQAAP
jgi:cytochrome c-type biogenesis protein CcmE